MLMLLAAIGAGFAMAFLGSVPPTGPISVLVLQRGVTGRYREGMAVAIGGALIEAIYCGLAVTGFAVLFARFPSIEQGVKVVGILLLLTLGIQYVRFRAKPAPAPDPSLTAEQIAREEAKGERRSFVLGVSVAAANPILIVTWSTSVAMLYTLAGLRFTHVDKAAFATSVFVGMVVWFRVMLLTLRRYSGRVTLLVAQRVIRGAGVVMIALAVASAWSLVKSLTA